MTNLRRLLVAAAIVVGVTLVGALIFLLRRGGFTSAAQEQPEYRVGTVERGDLRETISITGPVQARERGELSFLMSGKVQQINVTVGQRVRVSELLMQLDTSQLALNLIDAQLALELQRVAFDQLLAGPDRYDVASARATVAQAAAQLNLINRPPDENAIQTAQQNLEASRDELWRRQAYRDQVWAQYGPGLYSDLAAKDVESAELAVRIAEQELVNAQQGLSPYDIAIARASLWQAQATLNRLLEGPTEIDMELARIQIQQAELALQSAQLSLEDGRIIAPFDGIVAETNYQLGEQVVPGLPALVLIDDSAFHVDVMVDEIDIARIREAQLAFVRLDAWPDAQVSGHVTRVSPDGVNVGGVVSYQVRVVIDAADVPIRDGMTATVEIVVSELTNVLLVPNWAVRFDRASGKAYVSVRRADGTVEEIQVEIGVRGEVMSEVRSGLNEGDEVVVSLQQEQLPVFGNQGQ